MMISTSNERAKILPFGILGGEVGVGEKLIVKRRGHGDEMLPAKPVDQFLKKGDIMLIQTGAGGGYGDTLDRDSKKVLGDVINGYISMESAEREYGVVIGIEENGKYSVDEGATLEMIDKLRRA